MWRLPLQIGMGNHGPAEPHHVLRPEGCDGWLIECVLDGQAWIELEGTRKALRAGDWIAFPPGVRQHYAMDPAWRHGWLAFHPRAAWMDWLNWPAWRGGVLRLRVPPGSSRAECEALLQEGWALKTRHWTRWEAVLLNQIERILLRLDTINPNSRAAVLDERIRVAVDALCAQPERRTTLTELAARCNLSESRLSHLFRETMGLSPMQYQEQQRMARARELLVMTARPISAIAYACGYEDPLHFSRVFKRREGVSPRAYRQAARP